MTDYNHFICISALLFGLLIMTAVYAISHPRRPQTRKDLTLRGKLEMRGDVLFLGESSLASALEEFIGQQVVMDVHRCPER